MKRIFPHVFVFFAFIFLVYLGTWQVERREWKQELLAKVDSRIHQPPIALNQYKNVTDDEFTPMKLRGVYQFDKEFLLLNRSLGGKLGQYVFTPLLTDKGETILVNRGWIPTDKEYSKPSGEVEITGIVRATQKLNAIGKAIVLQNNPQKAIWFWIDLPKMYQSINAPEKDFFLDMVSNDYSSYPYALPAKIELYNEHLQYAITWYSIAIILLLVYYFRFFHKSTKR